MKYIYTSMAKMWYNISSMLAAFCTGGRVTPLFGPKRPGTKQDRFLQEAT